MLRGYLPLPFPESNPASQHHSITASQHHSITASQHHSITASQHHSITASQHHSIHPFLPPSSLHDTSPRPLLLHHTNKPHHSLLLEAGIFTSHLFFLLRTRSLRRRAKESSTPFDNMPEARKFVFPRPEETAASDHTTELADIEKGTVDSTATGAMKAESENSSETADEGKRSGSTVALGRWPSRS